MKPQEQWVIDFINGYDRPVTFKEISASSYWSNSATRHACTCLTKQGKIVEGERVVINSQSLSVFMSLKIARSKSIEKIDGHILSQCWPIGVQLPDGKPRHIRGIIHDEHA